MRTFMIIWLGQVVSIFGSSLTGFALGVWVYQRTGSVTQFALISVAASLPGLLASFLAGALVDRWDRRWTMVLCDAGAGLGTCILFLLFFSDRLELWHICVVMAVSSTLQAFQVPAFLASTSLIVPKQHLSRASGMRQLGPGMATIIAPVLAGALLVAGGLGTVMMIDVATFVFAVLTLLAVRIPRPPASAGEQAAPRSLRREMTFGWVYLWKHPGLLGMLTLFATANFTTSMAGMLITPLVLSFAPATVLGAVLSFTSAGMVLGGLVMSVWGGPKRRIHGVLGFLLPQGIFVMAAGLEPQAWVIAGAAFLTLCCMPITIGCSEAIWQSKVPPDAQGKVFAVRRIVALSSVPLAYFASGPLVDYVFEPLMAAGGPLASSAGRLLGVGPGRGIGLLFIVLGFILLTAVLVGYRNPHIRNVEDELPDALPPTPPTVADDEGASSPPNRGRPDPE